MPAAQYHRYTRKVLTALRRADAGASTAQRDAGVARVGKVYAHGLELSITHPPGSSRTDDEGGQRAVRNPYGYINHTSDAGDRLAVWLGDHMASQLVFTFDCLTPSGEHDERVAVLGCRNLVEAKKVITDNYSQDYLDDQVGEVRGYFFPEFRKQLERDGILKASNAAQRRGVHDDAKEPADREACPHCGAMHERGDDGFCNRCGEPWPAKTAVS